MVTAIVNIKNKISQLYDNLNRRITLSTGVLSFITSMIGFYIVHTSFFIKRHINVDYHHFIKDGGEPFFVGTRPLLGRFLGGLVQYYNTWTIGFICAIFLAIASVLMVKIFNTRSKISVILIALSIVSFPCLSNSYGYLFLAQNYSISICCAVLAVFLTKKYKYGFLPGAVVLMISLAEYQSYIAITMALSLVCIYLYMVNSQKIKKDLWIYSVRYLIMGILGVSLYLVSLNIFLKINQLELADYKGMSEIGQFHLFELPKLVLSAYKSFFQFYFGEKFFYTPIIIQVAYVILACCTLKLIYNAIKNKSLVIKILAIVFILLFPLCLSSMEIIAPETDLDTITAYSFVCCMVMPLIILEKHNNNMVKAIIGIAVICIIINNYAVNSRYYLLMDVVYEHTFAFENRLYMRIEETEGYEYGMPVAMIVDSSSPINNTNFENATFFTELRGERGGLSGKYIGINTNYLRNTQKTVAMFRNMLGSDVKVATQDQIDGVLETEEYSQLACYPAQGSTKVINGVMVVNFMDLSKMSEKDFEISVDENMITVKNNYEPNTYQYAWYIYKGTEAIQKFMYTDEDTLAYEFKEDGSYKIKGFIMNGEEKQSVTVCNLLVEDGVIKLQ